MRTTALAAACLAGTLAAGPGLAAPDRVYAIGGSGWMLERFGSGLAVLRARVATTPPTAVASGTLLLTCEGRERRLLLDLPPEDPPLGEPPRPLPGVGAPVPGRMLVARFGASRTEGFTAMVTIENGRRVTLADGARDPDAHGVMRFVRMLRQRPGRLNLLVSVGAANLTRDIPIHLVLTFGPRDAIALDDVASTCDPDEHGRTAPAR